MSDKKPYSGAAPSNARDNVDQAPTATERRFKLLQQVQRMRAAKATAQVTDRAALAGLRPLRDLELRSIYALFAWVANEQRAAEETVRCVTEARFGIADVRQLRQNDYDEVIKFLVDLRLDELKN